MNFFQSCVINVRVDLRRGDAGVAQHFLHLPKIGPARQKMGGKAVTQRVRANLARHASPSGIFLEKLPNTFASQASPAGRKNQVLGRRGATSSQLRPLVVKIFTNSLHCASPKRHDTLFVSFAMADTVSLFEMHIARTQSTQFRDTATGRVEQFENRPISKAKRVGTSRCGEKLLDLFFRKHMRNALPKLGRPKQLGLIVGQSPFELEVSKKDFQRCDMPGHTLGRQRKLKKPSGVACQLADAKLLKPTTAQPSVKASQITRVGLDRIDCQMAFTAQVVGKVFLPTGSLAVSRLMPRFDFLSQTAQSGFHVWGRLLRANVLALLSFYRLKMRLARISRAAKRRDALGKRQETTLFFVSIVQPWRFGKLCRLCRRLPTVVSRPRMQNIVIEEPYEFVPPVYGRFWPWLIKKYLNRHLRKNLGIQSIECRELPRLAASLEAGHGVVLAPNHCRMSDPLTLNKIAKELNCNVHAMASWHLFKQDWLTRFVLRQMGTFSVYREGVDRQAINTAVDILVAGKRPLVIFPEGAVSRHNDILLPMMDGTSFIARTAAKRRKKIGKPGKVVIHPIAIRYFFRGDLMATITPVLEEIESHFSWYPQRDRPLIPRLQQIAQALLSLKEIEYFGSARTGDFYERLDQLVEDELEKLEEEWKIKKSNEGIASRVKNLRTAILPDMVKNNITAEERHRRGKQLAACYYLQQMSHYPRHYVRTSEPNIPEHIIETVERFEEDFTDHESQLGPFHVVLQIGEAIEVGTTRDRKAKSDPVMDEIRSQLTEMLASLSAESPRINPNRLLPNA